MTGHKVDRVFGWDTHGLPAELEAMKQLGITEKAEIEEMGIATFNGTAVVHDADGNMTSGPLNSNSAITHTYDFRNRLTAVAANGDRAVGGDTSDSTA